MPREPLTVRDALTLAGLALLLVGVARAWGLDGVLILAGVVLLVVGASNKPE